MTGLVQGTEGGAAGPLLVTGGAIWLTNVIVFGLWYWEFDRGGPVARAHGTASVPGLPVRADGQPGAGSAGLGARLRRLPVPGIHQRAAFSPTDVMPLSRWAKMAMTLQATISIVTVALVVARAVNISGSRDLRYHRSVVRHLLGRPERSGSPRLTGSDRGRPGTGGASGGRRSPSFRAGRVRPGPSPGVSRGSPRADRGAGPRTTAAPEPVAVVEAVDDQTRLEHQRVRDHRVVVGVGVLGDVEVLLNLAAGVGQEGPLRADGVPELVGLEDVVGKDRDDLGVADADLRVVGGQLEVLLVVLGEYPPRESTRIIGSTPCSSLSRCRVLVWSVSS